MIDRTVSWTAAHALSEAAASRISTDRAVVMTQLAETGRLCTRWRKHQPGSDCRLRCRRVHSDQLPASPAERLMGGLQCPSKSQITRNCRTNGGGSTRFQNNPFIPGTWECDIERRSRSSPVAMVKEIQPHVAADARCRARAAIFSAAGALGPGCESRRRPATYPLTAQITSETGCPR